jgi:hypothetical protein
MFHFGTIAPKTIKKNPAATFNFEAMNIPNLEAANEALLQLTTKFAPFGLLTPMPSPKGSESPREDGVAVCAETSAESAMHNVSVIYETLSAEESETLQQENSLIETETQNHIPFAQPTTSTTQRTAIRLPSDTTEQFEMSQKLTNTTARAALGCGPSMMMDSLFTTKDFPTIPLLIQDTPRYVEDTLDNIEELSWAPKLLEAEPSDQDMTVNDGSCASSGDLVRTDSGVLMEDTQISPVDFSAQGLADCRLDTTVAMDRETSITSPNDEIPSLDEETLGTAPTITSPKDEPLSTSEDIPPTTTPSHHLDKPSSSNDDIYPTSISSGTYWSAIGLSRGPSALLNPSTPFVEIVLATLYPIGMMKAMGAAQEDGEARVGMLRDVECSAGEDLD